MASSMKLTPTIKQKALLDDKGEKNPLEGR